MSEYISRKAAIIGLAASSLTPHQIDDAAEALQLVPAADVVEVVRCRECKYRAEDDFCTGRGWPDQLVADDGFCEKGNRK